MLRLKSYLRNTISEERLMELALQSILRDIDFSTDEVLDNRSFTKIT